MRGGMRGIREVVCEGWHERGVEGDMRGVA